MGRRGDLFPPFPDRLLDFILSLNPTACWAQDDAAGPLRDASAGRWNAAVAASPGYGTAAREPINRCITWSASGQYATTSGSVPTPTTRMTVLSITRTSTVAANTHTAIGRSVSSQFSWDLRLNSSHVPLFVMLQAAGGTYAAPSASGAINDGLWHLLAGTFDGTTATCVRISETGAVATGSTTTLSGTWNNATTAPIQIAANNSTQQWVGDQSVDAYWHDRALSTLELRAAAAVAFGG